MIIGGWRKELFEAGTYRAELALHGLETGDVLDAKWHAEILLDLIEDQIANCPICGEVFVKEEGKRCEHESKDSFFVPSRGLRVLFEEKEEKIGKEAT